MSTILRRLLLLALALTLPLGTVGCVPGVTWLADSSGFVYRGGKDGKQILFFDVAQKKSRVLVEDTKSDTTWPAVSPDGKRFAIARLIKKDDRSPSSLQVVIYNMQGKEVKATKEIPWVKEVGQFHQRSAPQLFWAPDGHKVLIGADSRVGIYDVKTGELPPPREGFPIVFGSTPVIPGGKGFLAFGAPGYKVMDWQGQKISDLPFTEQTQNLDDQPKAVVSQMLMIPVLFASRWDGPVAQVSAPGWRVTIDTKKVKVTLAKLPLEKTKDGETIWRRYQFPEGKTQVTLIALPKPRKADGSDNKEFPKVRVELQKAGGNKPQVLVPEAAMYLLFPSPDQQWLVVRCTVPQKGKAGEPETTQDHVLVIHRSGEVVARMISTPEQPPRKAPAS